MCLSKKYFPFKGKFQPFELGSETSLIRCCNKLEARQLKKKFNDTTSREESKTIYCGLRISEMTLSNQSHFPRFFSPRKMTYRSLTNSNLRQAGIACPRKMTLGSWFHQISFLDLGR